MKKWANIAFWVCFSLVLVNAGMLLFTKDKDLQDLILGNMMFCIVGMVANYAHLKPLK